MNILKTISLAAVALLSHGIAEANLQKAEDHYTAEQVLKDMHYIYNDGAEIRVTLSKYREEIFCSDPQRASYLFWLIITKEVRDDIKEAIFKGMEEADELYCLRVS